MSFDLDYHESNLVGLVGDPTYSTTNFKKPSVLRIFHAIPDSSYDSRLKSSNA
jgi:hypothetical protein